MNVEAIASSILAYASWPLLTLAILVLWTAAAIDILRHGRRGTFTREALLGMAIVVSVVAVFAASGIFAVFAGEWSEAVSRAGSEGSPAGKAAGEDPRRAYIFSFGLENASYGTALDSGNATGSKTDEPR